MADTEHEIGAVAANEHSGNPPVPKRNTKGDPVVALEIPTKAPKSPSGAPEQQAMNRAIDPVRLLSNLPTAEISKLAALDMEPLSEFFRDLGMPEIPEVILRHNLNGSILHTVSWNDVEKMDFHSLGEAKAFHQLCVRLAKVDRSTMRQEPLMFRHLTFWGQMLDWNEGPCSVLNCTSVKMERNPAEKCCDFCTCSPKVPVQVPESSLVLYQDHLTINSPLWVEGLVPKSMEDFNRAFASPNQQAWKLITDNVDYTSIVDVDVVLHPKIDHYKKTCADASYVCCCYSLVREPRQGNFYWVSPCRRCCGYNHIYKERPEAVLVIKLRTPDDRGSERRVGIVEGSKEVGTAIMHCIEESQIVKAGRMRVT